MKARYKILIVIAGTVTLYMAIPGLMSACLSITDDCFVFGQLMTYTRLVVPGTIMWDKGDGIGQWTGTVEGIEEPSLDYFLQDNVSFIFFVLVVPALVIAGLVIRDKKK